MSRPVFEPTTQREVRRNKFSADQLFRRPAPVSAASDCTVGQWCRVFQSHNQTVPAGNRDIVEFDDVTNPYPTYFDTETVAFGFPNSAITILQSGIYAFTYRVFLDFGEPQPSVPFTTEMNGIDWDEFLYYERTWDPTALTGKGLHDSYVFRSDAEYGQEPPELYVIIGVPGTSTDPIVTGSTFGDADGSYMEIIRIGCSDINGDPNMSV